MDTAPSEAVFVVVVNHEDQYSIWPADKALPLGWQPAGRQGTRSECLEFVKAAWTDMRPRSLRLDMERAADQQTS